MNDSQAVAAEAKAAKRNPALGFLIGAGKVVGIFLLGILILLVTLWSSLALYYSNLPGFLATLAAAAFGLGTVVAFIFREKRLRTTWQFFIAFAVVLVYWLLIPASFDREWATSVAVMPDATIDGNQITVHNIRNFKYRSENDFDIDYYDKTYDLQELESVDLILSYWDGNRNIAHMMVSFGFSNGDWLTISIETRPEKSEGYSTITGLFKQFELIYIAADERDIVQLRTNHRGEDLYIYPCNYTPSQRRTLFMSLIGRIDEMAERPEWYNVIEHNCTTAWIGIVDGVGGIPVVFDIRLLLNGWLDQMAYERGRLVGDESQGLPYEEMRAQHAVSKIAQEFLNDPDFSNKIRARMPKRNN
ncbi:MAG: Lnb N-terminal periplasmic domain-containing protein [Planctomycetota bacterium]|jgi:hypothetical protein